MEKSDCATGNTPVRRTPKGIAKRLNLVRELGEAAEQCGMRAFRVCLIPTFNSGPPAVSAVLRAKWLKVVRGCVGTNHAFAWVRAVTPSPYPGVPVWNLVIWALDEEFTKNRIRQYFEAHARVVFAEAGAPVKDASCLVMRAADKVAENWGRRWGIRRFQVGGKAVVGLLPGHKGLV